MKKLLTYYIFGLLVFALSMTACTEDTSPASTEEPGGRVVFAFTIGSDIQTRATKEAGWEDWNENTIEKVDLYIFREGSQPRHLTATRTDLASTTTDYYTWTPTDLTRDDIQIGDEIYAVANCEAGGLGTVTSIEELKSLTVTGLETPGKQELFLMDGHITVETIDNTENILVTIPLKRAAAKIRLTFSTTSKADWEDRIAYRFCQYATKSTVLDLEEESYLDEAGIHTYPEGTEAESMHEVKAEDLYTYNGKQYLVLYSFANDWFDEDKAIYQTEPIVADKQTYILLKAPYEEKEYYYKIPVNYRLPTNNDDTSIKPEDYRHLYRLQRNYIYDITATIDREGGTTLDPGELLTLTYAVNAWEEEDITVNYEDNLSYTSSGWEEKDEEGNTVLELLANNTVHFVDPNGIATLSFMIQTPAVAIWRAVLAGADLNYFEFVGDHAGAAYQNDEPVAQTLSIRCTQPDSEDTHSVTLHVYATIGGKDYELDLTNTEDEMDGNDPVNRFTILQGR